MTTQTHTLLRRTAESLYWAGRALERAEDLARIVLVHGNTHVDLPVGEDIGWSPLLAVAGMERDFVDAYPAFLQLRQPGSSMVAAPEAEVVEFLLCAAVNPDSVLANVARVREAMRSVRPSVPREAWELTNSLWLHLVERRQDVASRHGRVGWLRRVVGDCERINGALWGTMRRDAAMAMTRMGQHLERAELTCRFLSVRAESAMADASGDTGPYEHIRAMSLLRSLAAYQEYRRIMPARPSRGSVVEFVLQDEAFPRTIAASLAQVREYLKELPACEEALAACADASVFVAGTVIAGLTPEGLRTKLGDLASLVSAVHRGICLTLFVEPLAEPAAVSMAAGRPIPEISPDTRPPVIGRYKVLHRTTYRYADSAEESHNETHLRPRATVRQRVLSSDVSIWPAADSRTDFLDGLGNHVTSFVVRGRFDELSITATSEVELFAAGPVPTGPPWESVRSTVDRDRRLDTRVARLFRSPSRLVPTTQTMADYATESFHRHRPIVEAVRELCGRINTDFVYEPGFTSVTTPVLEVFEARRGVCQDFAHIAVGCLRSIGLAARYVSGYIETFRSDADQLTGADASHAWASTYLPGWGWLDLDPTNNIVVCEQHVTTAWGRDYLDVSPVRGSVVGGGPSHELEVAVDVVAVPG